jgi:hypothetical protein
MRDHFCCRHVSDTIIIAEEGLLSRCPNCGMYLKSITVYHLTSKTCRDRTATRVARARYNQQIRDTFYASFTVAGTKIDRVFEYKYLGRILSWDGSDDAAAYARLDKARTTWGRMRRILGRDHASPHVMARFYLAIIQAILLYGSESWSLSSDCMRHLNAFHARCARFMAHKPIRRHSDGTWDHPATDTVLQLCGLSPLPTYIAKRKTTLLNSYARPYCALYNKCLELPSRSIRRRVWWDSTN